MSVPQLRTTLKASPAIARTVSGRMAVARIEALRARMDAMPGHGQTDALRRAEHHVTQGRLPQAGELMLQIERSLDERAEQAKVSAGLAETLALNTGREEVQEGHGTGEIRVLNRDGLLWLKSKKRLTGSPLLAAERYRGLYQVFHSGEVRTSRHDGGGGGSGGSVDPARAKIEAGFDLDDVHRLALHDDGALKWLVEAVCGRGDTLVELAKGDTNIARKLETELHVACRLLAKHFRIG